MKKTVILLAIIFSIASCGKEEIYSCDPEADMWVKSNIADITQMTRTDWIDIGNLVQQRAAYVAFTPNQKQALWIGKLEEVLKLDWTEKERQFIQTILEMTKVKSFISRNDRDTEDIDTEELEIYKWTEYVKEELGWDKNLLYALIATPEVMNANKTVKSGISNLRNPSSLKSRSESSNCECSSSDDWCFGMCYWTSACIRVENCGWWWGSWCDGKCR